MNVLTIEGDLCEMTESATSAEALCQLGLLETPQEGFKIVCIHDWSRSGAETCSRVFEVVRDGFRTKLIQKACVALAIGRSIDSIIGEWLKKRSLLELQQVATPRLYGHGRGMLLEEYIQYDLPTVLATAGRDPMQFGARLGHLIATIVLLGFRPIDLFADLRSRGKDVVVVDFGEDLGSPGDSVDTQDAHRILDLLIPTLQRWAAPQSSDIANAARNRCWNVLRDGEPLQS